VSTAVATVAVESASRWRRFDWQQLIYLVLLVGIGLVAGYSAGYQPGAALSVQTVRSALWAAIGLVAFGVTAAVDYHWLRTFAKPIYAVVLGLLAITLLAGGSSHGAQLSVSVGGLDFQFSEISKVLMVVVLAVFLASRHGSVGRLSTIVGAGLVMGLPTLMVLGQPDLGTALVFVAILIGMLFVAGAGIGWLGLLAGGAVVVAPIAVASLADYQRQRLFCFLDPYADTQGACYQLVQALQAVGSGGLLGQGLTAGRQNQLGYLPVQSTDFIFTVVAEELGFVGGALLLGLFGLLLWRILRIGWHARDALGGMVAIGLATMLVFQVGVNVGMVLGIVPVTGIPLPFISYGGSSLVSLLFGMGIQESVRIHADQRGF